MNRIAKIALFVLVAASTAWSQAANSAPSPKANPAPSADVNPVAHVRETTPWHFGPFVNYGRGVGDRSQYSFFWAGAELGKTLTPVVKAGPLSGQFELAGNIMPLWQAYTPAPFTVTAVQNGITYVTKYGGGTFRGVSVTPVILRWNFVSNARRFQPWFQGAGGLIYTTHKFPPNYMSNPTAGIDGGTSVWNFTPQGGLGARYFIKPKRSIDFQVNAVHISSASLGDKNPGVNASMQFQMGYTYWK